MKREDHRIIAERICSDVLSNETRFEKNLFVLGNVLPDRIVFTYLSKKGISGIFSGHAYINARVKIYRLIKLLNRNNILLGIDYLFLGCLTHFAADCFTYPHNECFTKGIKEHTAYEAKLHEAIVSGKLKYVTPLPFRFFIFQDNLYEQFEKLHEDYLAEEMGMANDYSYIGAVCEMLVRNLVQIRHHTVTPVPFEDYYDPLWTYYSF